MAPTRLSETATPEIIEKASAEIESLTAAVRSHPKAAPSVLEQEQRRAVKEQEQDLTAAMSALKRNPGNERVRNVVDSNVERGAETLKSIYVEQSL